MRIGIVPALNSSGGGIYQYSLTMLRALSQSQQDGSRDEFVIFTRSVQHPEVRSLKAKGWTVQLPTPPSLRDWTLRGISRVVGEKRFFRAWRRIKGAIVRPPDLDVIQFRPRIGRWFRSCGVDLMLYPAPTSLSFEAGIPYVMAIHDVQHRLQPEFPEVSADGESQKREYLYRLGCRYAVLLLADSEVGREDILNFYGGYGVGPDQVRVLPYLPAFHQTVDVSDSERRRVRAFYKLAEQYLFYPAQFWPHKNHTRIIQALGLLKNDRGLKVSIVFCGSATDWIRTQALREIRSLSTRLGLQDQVHFIGYVPDEDMAGLYAEAAALIMPTFFGPTNIPILEAWAFSCPVLTSDIRGIREQAGDAAILVDPRSIEAIAEGIYRLCMDECLRHTLILEGRKRLAAYTPNDYLMRLMETLEEAKARVYSQKF
jgi:glycosyltransferase involved in cell wall biosynthesis